VIMVDLFELAQIPLTFLLADVYALLQICKKVASGQVMAVQYLVNALEFHVNKLRNFTNVLANKGVVEDLARILGKLSSTLERYVDLLRDLYIRGRDREVRRGTFELIILLFKEREILREVEDRLFKFFKHDLVSVP